MTRVLISWIGVKADMQQNEINTEGPTFEFHRIFYKDYTKHILLTTDTEKTDYSKGLRFFSALKKGFPTHSIELQYMDIADNDVVNFNLIHSKIYSLLLKYKGEQIDIFISPGTPTMQVVWHVIHFEMGLNTKLVQTIKPADSKSKESELMTVQISQSPLAEFLIKKENVISEASEAKSNYCITPYLEPIYQTAHQIALTNKTTVLIRGETGTGKEHLAKEIHDASSRRHKPYVTINLGAIGPELLESRLFGYEKGAFTNANKTTKGYFHAANGGTIFLDEIGDINSQMQVALLRVIQSGEIQKVGSEIIEKVDVRIIAATNKDLYEECKKETFRWDLYYRLCVAEIVLPPLRERGNKDIDLLISYFNKKVQVSMGKDRNLLRFDKAATKIMREYAWPGNIRELENLIERFYAFNKSEVKENDFPAKLFNEMEADSLVLDHVIQRHVQRVVAIAHGNVSMAKKMLKVGSVNTVKKYLGK